MRSSILLVAVAAALVPHHAGAQTLELTSPLVVDHFRLGSSVISQADRDDMQEVIEWAKSHPWRLIIIQGYGDSVGDPHGNLTLSQDRADAARQVLIDLGLDPARIVSTAYGSVGIRTTRTVDVRATLDDYHDLIAAQHGR